MQKIKMRKAAKHLNCAPANSQQQQQQLLRRRHRRRRQRQPHTRGQQQFNNCMRRKSRKKRNYCCDDDNNNNNNSGVSSMSTTTTKTTTHTSAPAISISATCVGCNYYNCNKINRLLITTLLLLITMTATTTYNCQVGAAAFPVAAAASSAASAPTALLKSVAAAGTSSGALLARAPPTLLQLRQQQQQQRQLQQQQLFAMLTKNRQAAAAAATASGGAARESAITAHSAAGGGAAAAFDDADDDDDDSAAAATHPLVVVAADDDAAASLETTGFVADDGQQYEKAERVLAAAAAASNNNNNNSDDNNNNQFANDCPKECKCLNVYFDCSKQYLDRVPALPNYVQSLDLIANILNDTTVLQIQNLSELHKLSLKRNQLESVPKFVGLSALKQLSLAHNRIQRISSEALAALPKLKSLDLSKNRLHTLEPSFFPPRNRLAHLILNSNKISHIDEQTFTSLSDLLDLELNNNRLTSLPTGVFKNLNKLRKLSLNSNHLEINWSTFKGLHALQKLFLKSNNIRALQDGVFHVMRAIETIELDHNGITSLSRQGLFNLTKLHHLSISNNSISRIEPDTWEFTQSLFSLDLSHNNISEFKPQHLDCLQRLRQLNLGHNKIQYLVDTTFDCVKNLEDLNLRRNMLAWIIEDQGAAPPFKALRKLKRLDLNGNNLKQINSKSLSGLISLESLNLGGNALASIQSGAFEHISQLQKLVFKSPNFICDCELLWFRRWLQKSAQVNPQLQQHAVCGYPEHLLDRELLSLTPAELICADTPKPVITQEPSDQLAVKGANVTMECIANSPAAASLAAADELIIKWRHDNQHINGERAGFGSAQQRATASNGMLASYSTTETHIHPDQSNNQTTIIGYLRLYNVSYENAGRYQCVVSNAFGTTYSHKFKISIGIHPTFLQIPSNLTIDSGDSARLVCSATGDPMPVIALQKFGGSDFPAATERRLEVKSEENAFVITNAKPIDTGIYTCTAESAAGEIKINASLVVNNKPQPEIPLVRKETVLGESSVLECLSEMTADLNDPHREWYKDNKPFHSSSTSDSERYYFTAEKELLIIVNTQSMDTGHYRCQITDNSKTYIMQSELIVVKENFSQNVIIVGVVLVTVACIVIGSLIVWSILFYQKRKQYLSNGHAGAAVGGARVAAAMGGAAGGGVGAGSVLNQTQLTTLNRTFLQQPRSQQYQQQQKRPRSLADLDFTLHGPTSGGLCATEPRNRLIITPTPNYQQLLQRVGVGMDADDERLTEGFMLEYIQPNGAAGMQEAADNQDHLSSKDSGTGSDAAVKRSIEDFMVTLLPAGNGSQEPSARASPVASTPVRPVALYKRGRASLAKADTYTEDEDDEQLEFMPAHALGVSEYEYRDRLDTAERERFLHNNNQTRTPTPSEESTTPVMAAGRLSGSNFEADDVDERTHNMSAPLDKCKRNRSTNYNNATQVVDI